MGNTGSSGVHGGRRNSRGRSHPPPPPPQAPQPGITSTNRYGAAAPPYPPQYPNLNPNAPNYPYPNYYPRPGGLPFQVPAPYDYHRVAAPYPQGPAMQPPTFVEHQQAVTIRNDVNVKKETLRIEPDEDDPGKYLVAFAFDATVTGR